MASGTLQANYRLEQGQNGGRANWQWANSDLQLPGNSVTINVTEAGLHTLHIWQREDGLRLGSDSTDYG